MKNFLMLKLEGPGEVYIQQASTDTYEQGIVESILSSSSYYYWAQSIFQRIYHPQSDNPIQIAPENNNNSKSIEERSSSDASEHHEDIHNESHHKHSDHNSGDIFDNIFYLGGINE